MQDAQSVRLLGPAGTRAFESMATLSTRCRDRLEHGSRLVMLYGRPEGTSDHVVVTAVLMTAGTGAWEVFRAVAQPGEHYPSLSARFPSAQIHERELWEQTGLVPDDHPWLKPVRFEGSRQQHMAEYPFFSVRGQGVHEVGVGPIHAGIIEPGHFRFMCLGEQVHHLEIQLGYQHRGVEKLLLQRPPLQLSPLVESIAGDSCVAYAWGYCAAVEALAGAQVPDEVDALRGVALEMERIAMHVAGLAGLTTDIAFLQGSAAYGRLRTAIINASMRICGSRFGRGWLRPGKARGLDPIGRKDLVHTLTRFAHDLGEVNALVLAARSVRARFQGTGVLAMSAASDLGITGVAARASGLALDARTQAPARIHARRPLPMLVEADGDCWARMTLRMREIDTSVAWLLELLRDPGLTLGTDGATPKAALQPDSLCLSMVEGARGPIVQALETSPQGNLLHYKVQDPSLTNWFGLAMAVRNNGISDFPICNASFSLSYCGNDL